MTWGRRNIPGLALEGATEARVGRGHSVPTAGLGVHSTVCLKF